VRAPGLLLALAFGLAGSAAALAAAPAWTGLDWLIGDWTADGDASQGAGGFTFAKEAGGQIIVRRNFADYPARDGKPAERHDDLMVIWQEGGSARATYWDSEGHQIHYAVSAPTTDEVDFVSDDPAGPRYRLRYRRTGPGLQGSFEVAPPNARETFRPYLAWTAHRGG
jgi:hypothetical protein